MIVITKQFPLYEEYGISFQCTAAGDYDQINDVVKFHELLILDATYQARTGKAIPIVIDAESKNEVAERLVVSHRHRIMDQIRAAVNAEQPLNRMRMMADDPRWSDQVNRDVHRQYQSARDARVMQKHGGEP